MRTVAEHRARIRALGIVAAPRSVPVDDSVGHVLAEDISAPVAVPAFDVSAVDGFAVTMNDLCTGSAPAVRGPRVAGPVTDPEVHVAPGTAIQIMTGAQVPSGAQAVVPVEATSGFVDDFTSGHVRISGSFAKGANIRVAGGDIAANEKVLTAGTRLSPNRIGVLRALGRTHVRVRSALRVAVVSTGSELVWAGEDTRPGQIHESNGSMLGADLAACGATVRRPNPIGDDVNSLRDTLELCADWADLIVTTGGISAGTEDVVRLALQGRDADFGPVALKPGRPQGLGRVDGVPIVCLPGNPVSSFVSYEVFVRPVVRAALGHRAIDRPTREVPLLSTLNAGRAGYTRYLLGILEIDGVTPCGPSSGSIRALAASDCIIVVDDTSFDHGSQVRAWVLDNSSCDRFR
ncbi:molybdopterin molybdotransferase MoeA [Williamsia maris]|uniref:Molybdopterin molybdenumtransferase n=1 Tax=Williamsia maris TaxID=72806 RepID=A0ABT1HJG0_9NOCA|nr:gephyrin-like molybdotransferase Glp [Williamsia maris]MCP2178061.1 molybdopterin molybdotransferase [Williamsia maris]